MSFSKNLRFGLFLSAVMGLSACSGTTTGTVAPNTATYGVKTSNLRICSGYGCIIKDRLVLSNDDFDTVAAIMKTGEASAADERKAVSKAVAELEIISRNRLGYAPDIGFSYQKNAGKRGQMDCVDESLNTISYLKFLHSSGLLKYHKPIRTFAERGLLLDGRYPHKSARMRENDGKDWAVDSWKRDNGHEPEVITLAEWYRGNNDASQY